MNYLTNLNIFNIKMNKPKDADTIIFSDFLESFGLENRIKCTTNHTENTINLIMTQENSSHVSNIVKNTLFLDHHLLLFNISSAKTVHAQKTVTYKKIKKIDKDAFRHDIEAAIETSKIPEDDLQENLNLYLKLTQETLDKHAPLSTKIVKTSKKVPWFTDEAAVEIRKWWKLEKIWRTSKLPDDYINFYRQCKLVSNILDKAEHDYSKNKLTQHKYDYKEMYNICNELLGCNKDLPLPETSSKSNLGNEFNSFFVDKIINIITKLMKNSEQSNPNKRDTTSPVSLSPFRPLTHEEVKKIIMSLPSKLCENDTIPTTLLKEILPSILDLIVNIVNALLTWGIFPDGLKEVLVKPLLKKIGLELLKSNYRPVSNLTFISKVIKCCAAYLMTKYIEEYHLLEPNQSVLHANHSTETVILKVKSDILHAMDKQEVSCLVLHDLSAAFDTLDHQIFLECLENHFGITGLALNWIKSYLIGRTWRVVIGERDTYGAWSDLINLDFGVTQGLVLGPVLFMMYTSPLGSICRSNSIELQLFSDDQQLHLSFKLSTSGSQINCIALLEKTISETKAWMSANMHKLNDEKKLNL